MAYGILAILALLIIFEFHPFGLLGSITDSRSSTSISIPKDYYAKGELVDVSINPNNFGYSTGGDTTGFTPWVGFAMKLDGEYINVFQTNPSLASNWGPVGAPSNYNSFPVMIRDSIQKEVYQQRYGKPCGASSCPLDPTASEILASTTYKACSDTGLLNSMSGVRQYSPSVSLLTSDTYVGEHVIELQQYDLHAELEAKYGTNNPLLACQELKALSGYTNDQLQSVFGSNWYTHPELGNITTTVATARFQVQPQDCKFDTVNQMLYAEVFSSGDRDVISPGKFKVPIAQWCDIPALVVKSEAGGGAAIDYKIPWLMSKGSSFDVPVGYIYKVFAVVKKADVGVSTTCTFPQAWDDSLKHCTASGFFEMYNADQCKLINGVWDCAQVVNQTCAYGMQWNETYKSCFYNYCPNDGKSQYEKSLGSCGWRVSIPDVCSYIGSGGTLSSVGGACSKPIDSGAGFSDAQCTAYSNPPSNATVSGGFCSYQPWYDCGKYSNGNAGFKFDGTYYWCAYGNSGLKPIPVEYNITNPSYPVSNVTVPTTATTIERPPSTLTNTLGNIKSTLSGTSQAPTTIPTRSLIIYGVIIVGFLGILYLFTRKGR